MDVCPYEYVETPQQQKWLVLGPNSWLCANVLLLVQTFVSLCNKDKHVLVDLFLQKCTVHITKLLCYSLHLI